MTVKENAICPNILAPRAGMTFSDVAVHFLWRACGETQGYQIHYDRDPGFSGGFCTVIMNTVLLNTLNAQEADKYAYLPEQILEQGEWFWRVRAVVSEGKFGPWSETSFFKVRPLGAERPREIEISAKHPLFVLFSGHEVVPNWKSLEPGLRSNIALRVEAPYEELIDICREAQENGISIIAQIATCHDVISGIHRRISLSDVEYLFRNFSSVKGVTVVEQACQGGMSNPIVPTYIKRLLALAASYGKVVVWADGHWYGNNLWIDVQEDKELYKTLEKYAQYFVPTWKMNCSWSPNLIQSCVSGLWHSGAAAQWGVEMESWYWYEAGFKKLNKQYGFKEGELFDFPQEFYANMAVIGLSAGAMLYVLEPPWDIWSKPGETTWTWKEIMLPFFSSVLEKQLIPERNLVEEKIKIAYETGPADSLWIPEYGGWLPIFNETYGRRHPFQMIPQTGRYYWIPSVSRHRSKDRTTGFEEIVNRSSLTGTGETAACFNRYYPEMGIGSAWRVRVGDLLVIMHSHENRDEVQDFSIDLSGRFDRISGRLEVNSFVLIKQTGDDTLWLYTSGRREREVDLAIGVKGKELVDLKLSLPEACTLKEWNSASSCLKVRISHEKGAVSGDVFARNPE